MEIPNRRRRDLVPDVKHRDKSEFKVPQIVSREVSTRREEDARKAKLEQEPNIDEGIEVALTAALSGVRERSEGKLSNLVDKIRKFGLQIYPDLNAVRATPAQKSAETSTPESPRIGIKQRVKQLGSKIARIPLNMHPDLDALRAMPTSTTEGSEPIKRRTMGERLKRMGLHLALPFTEGWDRGTKVVPNLYSRARAGLADVDRVRLEEKLKAVKSQLEARLRIINEELGVQQTLKQRRGFARRELNKMNAQ